MVLRKQDVELSPGNEYFGDNASVKKLSVTEVRCFSCVEVQKAGGVSLMPVRGFVSAWFLYE